MTDSSPAAGAAFTLGRAERRGRGRRGTTLRYYQSADATITVSASQSADLTAPSAAGTYYYGACVDAVAGESDTANNCSTSVQVDVPQPVPVLPLLAQLLLALGLAAAGVRLTARPR